MAIAAALCIGIGVFPSALYSILPFPVTYVPYTEPHVLAQLQLLLFSALAFRVIDARVLDLFAGTGALGLEALSRGAARAVFADQSRKSIQLIRRNIAVCGFEPRSTVLEREATAAIRHLARRGVPFDLIFLDPPYNGPLLAQASAALVHGELIAPGGLVLAEHPADRPPDLPDGLAIASTKRYGKTVLS